MAQVGRGPREILVFSLAGQRYALWASEVRELLRAVAMTPLPRAPRIVEGVINLRGRIVPVLDIRSRFGLPGKPTEPSDHLIIAALGSRLVAIRADRALDLVNVDLGAMTLEQVDRSGPYVVGVARLADGLAVIHDLETFLDGDESAALNDALATAGAPA
jgi:purine-binding chemotaxis protein CheW